MTTPTTTDIRAVLQAAIDSITPLAPDLAAAEMLATVVGQIQPLLEESKANLAAAQSLVTDLAPVFAALAPLLTKDIGGQLQATVTTGNDQATKLQAILDELTAQAPAVAQAVAAQPQ